MDNCGGSASITDSPDRGSDSLLTQDASSWIQAGQMYRVAVDWSFSSGDFDVRLGGDSTYTEFSIESSQSSPYIFNIQAGATNDNLAIIANQHAVGDMTNSYPLSIFHHQEQDQTSHHKSVMIGK